MADTAATAIIGWWGLISFFRTPVTLLANVVASYRFRRALAPERPVTFGLPAAVLVVAVWLSSLVFTVASTLSGGR